MNVEESDERPMNEGDGTSVWESEFSEIFSSEFQFHNCHCCQQLTVQKTTYGPSGSAPYIVNRDDAQLSYHIGYIVWPLIVLEPIPKGPALWEYRC